MSIGEIDRDLPYIKRETVKALAAEYASSEIAAASIKERLEKFYQNKYPDVWNAKKAAIDKAIETATRIYQTNIFPSMKVSWKVYPDNIGHMIFPGCFRCHDDNHKSDKGKVLSKDCNACHAIIEQGPAGATDKNVDGLPFRHPDESEEGWKEMNCADCHTGD